MKTQKKRLCVIIPTHWSARMGGAQYQGKCLIEKLTLSDQFEIFYLAKRINPEFSSEGYRILTIKSIKGLSRYGSYFDAASLLKLLYRIKPNVIYQRVGSAYTGIAAYYARRNKCRMVWHTSSDTDVLPYYKAKYFKRKLKYFDKKILEYGVKRSSHIIAQSFKHRDLLRKYYGREVSKVVHNFHPLPEENPKKEDPIKLMWVSNFKPLKQPEYFIRLAKDILRSGQRVQCIMIGAPSSWPPDWQNGLEKAMKAVKNLSYLGVQPIEEVNSLLAQAHILVNTSLYEGFPNTFIQAWMRGVPVVSLNCNPDGVFDRHPVGFIAGTYEQMLGKTMNLIQNANLRNKIAENAHAYSTEKYSEKNIDEVVEILRG